MANLSMRCDSAQSSEEWTSGWCDPDASWAVELQRFGAQLASDEDEGERLLLGQLELTPCEDCSKLTHACQC